MWTEGLVAFGTEWGGVMGLDVFDVVVKFVELQLVFQLCAVVASEFLYVAVNLVDFICPNLLVLFL